MATNVIDEFEREVHGIVREAFPKLVAIEMTKLGGGAMSQQLSPLTWSKERILQLKKLYNQGLTQKAIGSVMGLSQSAVSLALKKLGIDWTINPPKPSQPTKAHKIGMSMHDALVKYGSKNAASKALGIHHSTFERRYQLEKIS
jgi:hypothetical protein